MTTRLHKASVALTAIAACLVFLPQGALATLQIQHWTNKHDVPVYFVALPELPMVDIQLRFVRSGHAHNGKKYGVASMTAKMIKQGSRNMNVDEIAETFDNLGARMGISSSYDSTVAKFRSLTERKYLDPALQACIEVLSSPGFPQDQFERLRKNTLSNIESKQQKPRKLAQEAFRKALYGDHPYAHPGQGTTETVNAMKIDDVRAFYEKHYVTSNLIISIVGAVSREQASDIADRITGSLGKGVPAQALAPTPRLKKSTTIRIDFPSEQAHVLAGQPFIKSNHPDRYALHLGNSILGGSGFGSRLFEEIRVNRGFAYSVSSSINSRVAGGSFKVSFQTRPDQADEAIEVADKVLRNFVSAGPTDEEIALTLNRVRGSSVFKTSSNASILSAVSRIAFRKQPLNYLETYVARYEKETRKSVTAAYQKHLHPDTMITVIVGKLTE